MADLAFQYQLIFGNFRVPVGQAIVAGLVKADDQFEPRVAHEGVRVLALQIAHQKQVLEGGEGFVLGARDADHRTPRYDSSVRPRPSVRLTFGCHWKRVRSLLRSGQRRCGLSVRYCGSLLVL